MEASTEVQLKKFKIMVLNTISEDLIDAEVDFSSHLNFMTNDIGVRVKGYIWSENVDTVNIQYPADWWQAVKERFAPKFILNRWPVKYIKHYIDVNVIYPNYRPALKDQEWRFKVSHNKYTWPEEDDD